MKAIFARRRTAPLLSPDLFSIRMLKYVAVLLMAWQGSMISGSHMEVTDPFLFGPIAPDEFWLIVVLMLTVIERTMTGDYTVRRSYFYGPSMLLLLALFISWCRGVVMSQRFAVVYEAHEALMIPVSLLVLTNAFREESDRWMLIRVLLLAPLFKALEGLDIYLFSTDPGKSWGVVEMWRDGYLLGLGLVSMMLFVHFKPSKIPKLRKLVLFCFPLVCFTLIMSLRRTFMVASVFSAFALIWTVGKGRRRKQTTLVLGTLVLLTMVIIATDPAGIIGRLTGIIEPKQEGSAYIRLLELPNVLQNIAHNPIWGTPIGTQWIQYYRMPISAVYTTLGTHDTYLYFPLRTGILGTISFLWLLGRMWKSILVTLILARDEDEKFLGQFQMHLLVIYQVACFFGLMYGDAMSSLFAMIMVIFNLQNEHLAGEINFARVDLWSTYRTKTLQYTAPRIPQLARILLGRTPKRPASEGLGEQGVQSAEAIPAIGQ